ncbi:MAG TPA: DUF885 domain-containing protein [Myxococcales bacterium]|jgi:uncharacterized protein (DUF885 family)|nr:DUF885 domain-containing protein [Myxococcales bacterium]
MNLLLCALLIAAAPAAEDARFEAFAQKYIQDLLEREPETATRLGDHRNDARLDDYSVQGVQREVAAAKGGLAELARIDSKKLSAENGVDYRILKNRLDSNVYELETLRGWQWNPLQYNVGGAIYALISRDFAPPDQRLRSAIGRLNGVPAVVAAAKANLKSPPKVHTETAIQQNKGTVKLVKEQLEPLVKQAPALEKDFRAAQATALAALADYQQWLEKDLLPRSDGNFRLGDEKFRKKLRFALDSDLSKEEILRRAEADLKSTRAAMYHTAVQMWPKLFPDKPVPMDQPAAIKAVLDEAAKKHPNNETILAQATKDLDQTTAFVREKGIVTVLDEPLEVVATPEFQRGVAVASCSPAGPLEKNKKTFYYISPTPEDWSPQRVESFFREYNDAMLQETTIHEAMPGHYLQLAHANRFRAPTLVRGIIFSGTFVEGWATYAEQLMADAGYGGPEVRMQQLKIRLRFILNAIIDQKIHTEEMTEQQAIARMMKDGFQEEGEAVGKWKRAQLTSTQLSTYYVGNAEMNDIRAAWEQNHGKYPDLRALHDAMLSFGNAAPKYVRERLGL